MSIYATILEMDDGCSCAPPLIYRGSHVVPTPTDQRGGAVDVAQIPDSCHPSVPDGGDGGTLVDFLRIHLAEDPWTCGGGKTGAATVVLARTQVALLRDTLTAWLDAGERN